MNPSDLNQDLSLLKSCEFVRLEQKDDRLILQMVMDNEEEEEHDHESEEEDHDCCEGLNGRLFFITFYGVHDFSMTGEECDNYVLLSLEEKENYLHLSYEGRNLFEDDATLDFHFCYQSYTIEDHGKIESPEV